MQPKTPLADFEALTRRAGLTLSEAQVTEMYRGWFHVERMLERLRTPPRPREAEPAHIFRPDQNWEQA
jgi:hypothetical protein